MSTEWQSKANLNLTAEELEVVVASLNLYCESGLARDSLASILLDKAVEAIEFLVHHEEDQLSQHFTDADQELWEEASCTDVWNVLEEQDWQDELAGERDFQWSKQDIDINPDGTFK